MHASIIASDARALWHSSASCAAASHPSAVSSMDWHACVRCYRHCCERGEGADSRAGQGKAQAEKRAAGARVCRHHVPAHTWRAPRGPAQLRPGRPWSELLPTGPGFFCTCAPPARSAQVQTRNPLRSAHHTWCCTQKVIRCASRQLCNDLLLVNCACARTLVRSAGDSGCRGERASS